MSAETESKDRAERFAAILDKLDFIQESVKDLKDTVREMREIGSASRGALA